MTAGPGAVWLNGRVVAPDEAVVSVFDHGFTVGDGVFETLKVIGGKPFAVRRHLERLARSASGLGIPVPLSEARLRDVVDEVGRDPVRFMMLYRKNDAPLDFDFAKVTEQSKDNPVFYVQYAHARAASVLRNAREAFPGLEPVRDGKVTADLSLLTDVGELDLVRKAAFYPALMSGASTGHPESRSTPRMMACWASMVMSAPIRASSPT